ncbi:hypothetical protein K438DRAFT_2103583 [Mycena galopus ATCC 62051]|nr:hypothetical protein K438DRAFT_2103583 [Mycena galopus ATCC 62051]
MDGRVGRERRETRKRKRTFNTGWNPLSLSVPHALGVKLCEPTYSHVRLPPPLLVDVRADDLDVAARLGFGLGLDVAPGRLGVRLGRGCGRGEEGAKDHLREEGEGEEKVEGGGGGKGKARGQRRLTFVCIPTPPLRLRAPGISSATSVAILVHTGMGAEAKKIVRSLLGHGETSHKDGESEWKYGGAKAREREITADTCTVPAPPSTSTVRLTVSSVGKSTRVGPWGGVSARGSQRWVGFVQEKKQMEARGREREESPVPRRELPRRTDVDLEIEDTTLLPPSPQMHARQMHTHLLLLPPIEPRASLVAVLVVLVVLIGIGTGIRARLGRRRQPADAILPREPLALHLRPVANLKERERACAGLRIVIASASAPPHSRTRPRRCCLLDNFSAPLLRRRLLRTQRERKRQLCVVVRVHRVLSSWLDIEQTSAGLSTRYYLGARSNRPRTLNRNRDQQNLQSPVDPIFLRKYANEPSVIQTFEVEELEARYDCCLWIHLDSYARIRDDDVIESVLICKGYKSSNIISSDFFETPKITKKSTEFINGSGGFEPPACWTPRRGLIARCCILKPSSQEGLRNNPAMWTYLFLLSYVVPTPGHDGRRPYSREFRKQKCALWIHEGGIEVVEPPKYLNKILKKESSLGTAYPEGAPHTLKIQSGVAHGARQFLVAKQYVWRTVRGNRA